MRRKWSWRESKAANGNYLFDLGFWKMKFTCIHVRRSTIKPFKNSFKKVCSQLPKNIVSKIKTKPSQNTSPN